MLGSKTREYKQDKGESFYRRSLYTFWKRAAPPASMEIFNAPSRETCTVRRERTNTPLQALVTLNDPQFVEAARNLRKRSCSSRWKSGRPIATCWPNACWHARLRAEEMTICQIVADRSAQFLRRTWRRCTKACCRGRIEGRC